MNDPNFPYHPHPALSLVEESRHGVFSFLRPSHATFKHDSTGQEVQWTARDQRKGRHQQTAPKSGHSRASDSVWHKLARMTVLEYWNISWWVAMLFTLGSVVWVINGFYAYLPFGRPELNANNVAIGWTAWVGATIFEFGSLLLIWEAWNRGEVSYFGWSLDRAMHHKYKSHTDNGISIIDDVEDPSPNSNDLEKEQNSTQHKKPVRWIWFTTDTKYWKELGFVAGVVQLFAASIFWISGFTGIPEIQDSLKENTGLDAGIFWTPQVIGGSGFMISSALYMLESQKKWYKPEPTSLGWHVGFWNFVGGTGFMLCGAFGYSQAHPTQYQSTLSTFWGGWSFLLGSSIQLYEAVNPVNTGQ